MIKFHALLLAAGSSSRFAKSTPKQYLKVKQRPLIDYSLDTLIHSTKIVSVNIAIKRGDKHQKLIASSINSKAVNKINVYPCGGNTRAATVLNLLKILQLDNNDYVVIHDAARPLLHQEDLHKLLNTVTKSKKPTILAAAIPDTVKEVTNKNIISKTLDRNKLYLAQTPQVVPIGMISQAYTKNINVTDEAQALENIGVKAQIVVSKHPNLKLTTKKDLDLITKLL